MYANACVPRLIVFRRVQSVMYAARFAVCVGNTWEMFCSGAHTNLMGREDGGGLSSRCWTAAAHFAALLPYLQRPKSHSRKQSGARVGLEGRLLFVCVCAERADLLYSPQSLPMSGPQVLISTPEDELP